MEKKCFVAQELEQKANLYDDRNAIYGDNYKRWGGMVQAIMKEVTLKTPDDFNRFGVLVQLFSKISRYAIQFEKGGHADSLDDLAVYSMMLKELDLEAAKKKAYGKETVRLLKSMKGGT